MTTTSTRFIPEWASPPGDTLADLLDEHRMTQTELAERLGVSLKHINRVIKGAASLSAELALGLEKVFGASASFWMTREAHYQADKARQAERVVFADSIDWAKLFPVAELRRRKLLPPNAEGAELVEQMLGFLGLAQPSQWKSPQVAYRKSQKFESDEYALSAWLREGEIEANSIDCAPYNEARFLDVLQQARSLTQEDPEVWWPELQVLCAAAGVAIVIVDAYPGAKANGATRWLAPDKALIQLSLRYKWADIFWFSFFHEAGHVVLHRKKGVFVELSKKDAPADPERQQLEDEADRFAARTLIPPGLERRMKDLRLVDIPAFAKSAGVSSAIVVGRLQHEGRLPWSKGNNLRTRLRFVSR